MSRQQPLARTAQRSPSLLGAMEGNPICLVSDASHDSPFTMPHIAFWRDRATAYEAISLAERLVLEGRAVASPPRWVFTIPACDAEGFSIRLDIDRFGSHGWIGGIEEEFDSIRAAFALVRYALNEHCRLRIMVAGGKPKEWILEHRADRNWQALLAARTFEFTSLFTRKEVFIRHNRFGSADRQTVMP